jgi:alkanesulfonate monooxygenase SsuD/methylene tetrahydromethanopterin reductase-like flavin-dependent oxidoreductase (luciferase family)
VKLALSIEIQEGMTYAATLAMARAGEALGFDAALLAEHYYPSGSLDRYPGGPGERMSADAWMYLAGLARETEKIRLGTLVSPVTFRHPAVLAKMAATLDHLSNGRAELGIGAGWLEAEHRGLGFDFASPAQRVDLVEEQLQVITGLWSRQPFTHNGPNYTLDDAYFTPRPVQQPRPTVIIGGRTTSRRLARLAATYADEFVIGQPTPEDCQRVRARLEPSNVKLSAFVPFCIGETQAEVDHHMQTYRATNPQYVRMMDNTSTWLLGTPEQVHAQLELLANAGVARLIVSVNCDLHREMLPLLARAHTALALWERVG